MAHKDNFQYSQASLQDFSSCNRRFYYRYLEKLKWPAVESAPVLENENFMRRGSDFHLLVHQYVLGIDVDSLKISAEKSGILDWWESFLQFQPFDLGDDLFAEKKFITGINQHRLLAKFDLVVKSKDGNLTIFDWKTSHKRPSRSRMENKWQSKVYPYVLAKMGNYFKSEEEISPENIQLHYWYPQFPSRPEIFSYSHEKFIEDEKDILALIEKVEACQSKEDFPLTLNQKICEYCVYRSLCERGTQAGNEIDRDDDFAENEEIWEIDFEQVGEIAY